MTQDRKRTPIEQTAQNLSYVMGMYGATIKMLLDEINNPGTDAYREVLTDLANRTLKRGDAIFKANGEKTYEQVMEEMELLLQMP